MPRVGAVFYICGSCYRGLAKPFISAISFPFAPYDSKSVLAVKAPLRRFAP